MEQLQYFYIIQHIPSKKYYAGSKYAKSKCCHPDQLLNPNHAYPYYTSSKLIKSLMLEDGVESFRVAKIKILDDAYAYETKFLKRINAKDNKHWLNSHNNNGDFGRYTNTTGIIFTKERCENISKSLKGKPLSKAHKEKVSKTLTGRNLTDEHKKNIGLSGLGIKKPGTAKATTDRMLGVPKSQSVKNKISESMIGIKQNKVECPHCNKIGGERAMKRFHFDNCKLT